MGVFIKTIASGMAGFFTKSQNDPLVRLFEVEYNREYRALKAQGVEVDRNTVLYHMKEHNG